MSEFDTCSDGRRRFLKTAAALGSGVLLPAPLVRAQSGEIRIGLLLPYTGTYSQLGKDITDAFKLYVAEKGGKLAGRDVKYVVVDDESDPSKAPENTNKLVTREKVDFLIGTVHSGVAMGMVKIARETGVITIIPNAGTDAATGPMCAPNIFRASFSTWQTSYPMGKVMVDKGHKRAVFISWKYAFGEETLRGFKEGYEAAGGKIVKEMFLPFPNVEFQPYLTEIASLKPDAVFVFFAGSGAVKFVKDYAAAGLKNSIPLYGSGFLTDGTLQAQGEAAEGILTTLHYGDGLNTARDNAFRSAYQKAYGRTPDVYAVQGYDTAQLLAAGLEAVKGDVAAKKDIIAAMEKAVIDSPRGRFTMSRAHNPIQDIYLRRAEGGQNKVIGVAAKALADPARGCKML
jgi:branched-chain amino acid transport system substrate-binding protein